MRGRWPVRIEFDGVIVEFVGLPGSGKTTLWRELRESDALGLVAQGHPGGRGAVVRAGLRYWRAALVALRVLVRSPRSWEDKLRAARWFLATLAHYGVPAEIVLLDEGLVQRSFLLFAEREQVDRAVEIERYFNSIPVPDVVIALIVAPAICVDRLHLRPRSVPKRFRGLSPEAVTTAFTAGWQMIEGALAALASSAKPCTIVRLAADDLDEAKIRLRQDVVPLLRQGSPGRQLGEGG